MDKEELKRRKTNYLALYILYYMKKVGYSPFNVKSDIYVLKTYDGRDITLKNAYLNVRKNVNYLDDELLKKINEQPCVIHMLKKDCNNK